MALEFAGVVLFNVLWSNRGDFIMWIMSGVWIAGVGYVALGMKEPLLFWGFLLAGTATIVRSYRAWRSGREGGLQRQLALTALLLLAGAVVAAVISVAGAVVGSQRLQEHALIHMGCFYFTAQALREILPIDDIPAIGRLFTSPLR